MEFNKEHKVKIETLSAIEKPVFRRFLNLEKWRHTWDIQQLQQYISFGHSEAMNVFLWSAIYRHQEDLEGIENLLKEL